MNTRASKRWARILLLSWTTLAVSGALLLYLTSRHNGRYDWRPLRVPFRVVEGDVTTASFEALLDEEHEIELEFAQDLPPDVRTDYVEIMGKPSPLDVSWTISSEGETVARGASRDYLYRSSGGTTWKGRVWRRFLNIPFHTEGAGTVCRGIGRFEGEAGRRYDLRVEVGATVEALDRAEPHVVVRLARQFWERQKADVRIAYLGLLALVGSGVAFLAWALAALTRKTSSDRESGES